MTRPELLRIQAGGFVVITLRDVTAIHGDVGEPLKRQGLTVTLSGAAPSLDFSPAATPEP